MLAISIAVDLFFAPASVPRFSIFLSDFIVTFGYLLIAVLLRDGFKFDIRKATFANVIALLAVAPMSAVVTSALYCGALYLTGVLNAPELLIGSQYFWIGDAVGMIVLLPAIVALYDLRDQQKWRAFLHPARLSAAFAIWFGIALLIVASLMIPKSRFLFNLLYLPTIWVGIGFGFNAVAITLLVTQLILVGMLHGFHVPVGVFAVYQTEMFILAATGQLLGAAMTERESATRDLGRQRADLTRLTAHATTGALAAAFAHEVSQPLSALSGYVHAARRMLANPDDREGAAAALQSAEAETRRAREIITRIREFVSSGRLDLVDCDVVKIADKIFSLNRDEASARGVVLTWAPPGVAMIASVDRIAIEQALNNLVVNAIDAAGGGRTRGLVIMRVRIEGACVQLAVEDNGPGVSDEIADHLFDAFETTKTARHGPRSDADRADRQETWWKPHLAPARSERCAVSDRIAA